MTCFLPDKMTHFQNWRGKEVDGTHDLTNNVAHKSLFAYKRGLSFLQGSVPPYPKLTLPAQGKWKPWASTKCVIWQNNGLLMVWSFYRWIFPAGESEKNTAWLEADFAGDAWISPQHLRRCIVCNVGHEHAPASGWAVAHGRPHIGSCRYSQVDQHSCARESENRLPALHASPASRKRQ